jgi:hypothetical protein
MPHIWDDFCRIQSGKNVALLRNDKTCIVMDEIFTVSPEMLDLIDANVCAVRGRPNRPFGGLQVLLFGDFYQLPSVVAKDHQQFSNEGLAFESHF